MYNNLPPNYSEPEDGHTCPICHGQGYTLEPCCPQAHAHNGVCSECGEHCIEVGCFLCEGVGEISPSQMRDYNTQMREL